MGFFKTFTRNKSAPGSLTAGTLGYIARSIGYLQGGYFTGAPGYTSEGVAYTTGPGPGNSWSQIQLFNTVNQTGSIVYDTGYYRRYAAGVSGNLAGYFSINNNTDYNKFSYVTASATSSFTTPGINSCTAIDLNLYTQAWILESASGNVDEAGGTISNLNGIIANWIKVNLTTDTPTNRGDLDGVTGATATSRQAMNTATHGFFINTPGTRLYSFNFSTEVVAAQPTNSLLDGNIQIACGMPVTNTYGYFVGLGGATSSSRNVRVTVSGATVLSYSSSNAYTYLFGESHSLVGEVAGYMMAGYPDTSGRYSSVQHALCQRMTLTTEAISTLPDLVLPQSSGQMMQGF
jgi:hypothetical protein